MAVQFTHAHKHGLDPDPRKSPALLVVSLGNRDQVPAAAFAGAPLVVPFAPQIELPLGKLVTLLRRAGADVTIFLNADPCAYECKRCRRLDNGGEAVQHEGRFDERSKTTNTRSRSQE